MTMNARKALIETYQAAITAIAKRGTLKNARYEVSAAERAAGVEVGNGVYAASTDTKADFVAYCEDRLAALIANDHAEALEIVLQAQIKADLSAGRPVCEETGADLREFSGVEIEEAHAEALIMNATFDASFRRRAANWGAMDMLSREVTLDRAHAVALVFNAEADELAAAVQWDEWANQHDSRKTESEMIESDHAEALEINAEIDRRRSLSCDRTRRSEFHELTEDQQARIISLCHAEALEIEATREAGIAAADRIMTDRAINAYWIECETMIPAIAVMEWERLHAEALRINSRRRVAAFFGGMDYCGRQAALEQAHAEALAVNEQYDLGIEMAADHEYRMIFSYLRPWAKKMFIDVSHAEALALNAVYDRASLRFCEFHLLLSMAEQADQIDAAHLEALVMDAEKEAVA